MQSKIYYKVYYEKNKSRILKRESLYRKTSEGKRVSKRANYRRKFGLEIEDIELILSSQDYRCLICKIHQNDLPKALAVDHCHNTGRIRGMLCSNCNTALGMVKDSIWILKELIEYLNKTKDA